MTLLVFALGFCAGGIAALMSLALFANISSSPVDDSRDRAESPREAAWVPSGGDSAPPLDTERDRYMRAGRLVLAHRALSGMTPERRYRA